MAPTYPHPAERPKRLPEEAANDREFWRWHFAGLALEGILANPMQPHDALPIPRSPAEEAQVQAYDLLQELERTAKP